MSTASAVGSESRDSCGCCCSDSKDNCDLITAKFIAAVVCSECRVVNVVAVIRAMMWLPLQGLL